MDENNGNGNDNQVKDQQSANGDNQASAPQSASGGSEQQGGGTGQSGEKRWPEPVDESYPGAILIAGQYWRPEDTDAWMQMHKERLEEADRRWRAEWLNTTPGKLCLEFYQKFQEYKKYLEDHPCE